MMSEQSERQNLVFLYSIRTLYGCQSVACHFYISSLSFDSRTKNIAVSDRGIPCQEFCVPDI